MIIFLAVLLLLILLAATLRMGMDAGFGEDGPWLKLRVGPGLIQLYPGKEKDPEKERKKKEKKERKQEAKEAKKAEKKKEDQPKRKRDIGGLLELVWDLLPVVGEAAGKFRRKIRIDTLCLDLTWGEEDPADAAIHYGYAWAAAETLLSFLEAIFELKEREVSIWLDYQLEKPRVCLRAGLSLTLAQLLGIGLTATGRSLKVLWEHRKAILPDREKTGGKGRKGEEQHGKEPSHQ